jgi:hypothetical protein
VRCPQTQRLRRARYSDDPGGVCLDHFLVFGAKHFDDLVREYAKHYHKERPYQGLENDFISGEPPPVADCEIRYQTGSVAAEAQKYSSVE